MLLSPPHTYHILQYGGGEWRAYLEGWQIDLETVLEPYRFLEFCPIIKKPGQFCLSSPLPSGCDAANLEAHLSTQTNVC